MNRKQLLESNLTEEKNVATLVTNALTSDAKAFKKLKRDVEDEIEEAEDKLEERLSSSIPLDKSVVEVTYRELKDAKEKLELYKEFEEQFLKVE